MGLDDIPSAPLYLDLWVSHAVRSTKESAVLLVVSRRCLSRTVRCHRYFHATPVVLRVPTMPAGVPYPYRNNVSGCAFTQSNRYHVDVPLHRFAAPSRSPGQSFKEMQPAHRNSLPNPYATACGTTALAGLQSMRQPTTHHREYWSVAALGLLDSPHSGGV